jgi:hypothetical protein
MDCMAAAQALNHEFSQENNAVTRRPLGLDRGPAPNDECGDYESDNTRQCSPPMAKHNVHAHCHQEQEQNRQTPA